MKLIALFFVLCLISKSFAALDFSGNVSSTATSSAASGEFNYRRTAVWLVPVDLGIVSFTLAGYASLAVAATGSASTTNGTNVTSTNVTGSVNGDLIVGAVLFATGIMPVSFMGHFSASYNQVTSLSSVSGLNIANYDYSAAAGFVLTSYLRLEERNPSGGSVRNITFSSLVWAVTNGNNSKNLHYVTVTASNPEVLGITVSKIIKDGESVSFTFLVSEVLGQVTFGASNVYLSPKTLESVIQVSNYQYASSSNYLVLVSGACTGSSSGSSAGAVTVASGTGDNQVFVNYAGTFDANGKLKSATVNSFVVADISTVCDTTQVKTQISAAYNATFSCKRFEIAFSAGEETITYDPAMGAGSPLINQQSGVNAIVSCMSVLFLIVGLFI